MYDPAWSRLGEAFEKDFAQRHALSIQACHIGPEAAQELAGFASRGCGSAGIVISDENTRQAGGEDVLSALTAKGKTIAEKVYAPAALDATEECAIETRDLTVGSDFIVAVGSGTLCDLAKYAGDALNIPVLLYATAASMNGYTSGVVALKVRGLKRTLPCAPAAGVFANPEHAATAPQRMTAAGVADFLSKCSSTADWRASHFLLDVPYVAKAREFSVGIQERILDRTRDIGRADPGAVALVLEALCLSGFSMVAAGSSAPASGGEHLISHYLDMKSALYGLPHDLHGTQVGVATVYCLGLWEKILALDPDRLDVDALVSRQPCEDEVRRLIEEDWGPVAPEVQRQWDDKRMNPDGLRAHLEKFRAFLPKLRQHLAEDLLPADTVRRAIEDSGGPADPEKLLAPIEEYRNAQARARYIRNRFTVLDLAEDLAIA